MPAASYTTLQSLRNSSNACILAKLSVQASELLAGLKKLLVEAVGQERARAPLLAQLTELNRYHEEMEWLAAYEADEDRYRVSDAVTKKYTIYVLTCGKILFDPVSYGDRVETASATCSAPLLLARSARLCR